MLQMRGGDKRLYNPDRDLVWAMPRLISTALKLMGEDITTDHVRGLMIDRCIEVPVPDERLREELESFIRDMARFLNELKDNPEVQQNPHGWFEALFAEGPRAGVRALVADFLMTTMFAELPIWFESLQPEKDGCIPNVEEVQRAVESILGRGVDGEGSTDE
jgi:hypothetical protein